MLYFPNVDRTATVRRPPRREPARACRATSEPLARTCREPTRPHPRITMGVSSPSAVRKQEPHTQGSQYPYSVELSNCEKGRTWLPPLLYSNRDNASTPPCRKSHVIFITRSERRSGEHPSSLRLASLWPRPNITRETSSTQIQPMRSGVTSGCVRLSP